MMARTKLAPARWSDFVMKDLPEIPRQRPTTRKDGPASWAGCSCSWKKERLSTRAKLNLSIDESQVSQQRRDLGHPM